MNRRISLFIAVLLLPMLLTAMLFAASRTQAGSPDICASGCTYATIQEAVNNDSAVGTTLTIAAETFSENVEITRSITLVGAGSALTIVDGQMTDTVFLISDGATVTISNLTIQNGDTTSVDGGGLLNENSTVTLNNVIVENNHSPSGAGIANDGTMIVDNITVRYNVADELVGNVSVCTGCAGGGIYNTSVMTISNSFIYSNTGQFGGGIDNAFDAMLTATNIELYDNEAKNNPGDPSAGGGIENLGTMTLTNSIVRNNTAPVGGGIVNAGTLTLTGSDLYANMGTTQGGGLHNSFNATVQTTNFYDNQAGSGGGGGISSESGTVLVEETAVYNNSASGSGGGISHNVTAGVNSFTLINSTLSGNSAAGVGGGIRNAGVANTTLQNVTLANNTATVSGQSISLLAGTLTTTNSIISTSSVNANCSGAINSQGYNIASDSSCNLNGTADLPNTNPQLGALQNNGGSTLTHALLVGSPAIDSGDSGSCPATDQRGAARPFGSGCDRGAYEFDQIVQSLYLPFVIR